MRILIAFAALAATAADDPGKSWWSHVQYLASDALEGRKAGTAGYEKAAKYVAARFDELNLRPGGSKGWYQPVPYERKELDETQSKVELILNGRAETLNFQHEVNLSVRGEPGRVLEAEMAFVGNGLVVAEAGIDDLKGMDLKGRIAVVLPGAPKTLPGPLASHAQSTAELWRGLRRAGAIGIARLYNTNRADIPWERHTLARAEPVLVLGDRELVDTEGQQAYLTFSAAGAAKLLEGSGHTYEELLQKDRAGEPLPAFPLRAKIRVKAAFSVNPLTSDNVIGVLPGSDPALKNEFVVFSAHLDHLGTGEPIAGDAVYNGAMDNASGVATLIETARAMQRKKLKRSVAFVAVTGEESGLTGSRYFASHPTLNGRVVADLNTDMYLPIIPLKGIAVMGMDESDLGAEFAAAANGFGVAAERDPEPQRNSFTRSDQYSFIRLGIPALAFKFYAAPGTPEAATIRKWRTERYHAPSDDLNQPVNIEGAARFNTLMAVFLERVANRIERPHWKDESFFRRFASQD